MKSVIVVLLLAILGVGLLASGVYVTLGAGPALILLGVAALGAAVTARRAL